MLTIFLRHQPNVRTSINAACLLEKMAYITVSQGQTKRWWGIKKIRKNEKELKKNIEARKEYNNFYKEANTRGDCVCVCERNCKHVCNRVHSVRIV